MFVSILCNLSVIITDRFFDAVKVPDGVGLTSQPVPINVKAGRIWPFSPFLPLYKDTAGRQKVQFVSPNASDSVYDLFRRLSFFSFPAA
jgi:hypothetical protein